MEKIRQFSPFLIPSLLATLVFISSNQQFFAVADDDSDSDAGISQIEIPAKHINPCNFAIASPIPEQNGNTPVLAVAENIPVLSSLPIRANIFFSIKEHSPPMYYFV